MATTTATELTIEHYRRPEVKEIITASAVLPDGTWRALNGDFRRWYAYNNSDARLLNAKEDYDHLTDQFRVLYQTLNVFDPGLWMVSRPKAEITPENPLGTPADTLAYTLGVDIDKGRDCTLEDPEIKAAVEDAAKFLIDCLKAHGIHQSVWVLFSGGGIYVEVHHEIVKPMTEEGRERKTQASKRLDGPKKRNLLSPAAPVMWLSKAICQLSSVRIALSCEKKQRQTQLRSASGKTKWNPGRASTFPEECSTKPVRQRY